jgi:hypothetical protein
MSTEGVSRYHVRRREFLNEDTEAAAFIIAVVEDTRAIPDENEQGWKWAVIQLDLADCSRRVSFDFSLNDPENRANSLRKINLMAEIINQVRDAIELECESRAARPHIQLLEAAIA